MKIWPLRAMLFQTDGLTDVSKLIIVFLSLTTASTLKSDDQRRHDEACKTVYQKTAKKFYNYCCYIDDV
jgi:hypothetical protein